MKLLCVFLTVSITERNSDKNAKSERKGNNYKKVSKANEICMSKFTCKKIWCRRGRTLLAKGRRTI